LPEAAGPTTAEADSTHREAAAAERRVVHLSPPQLSANFLKAAA
jgi:hypothetical protein